MLWLFELHVSWSILPQTIDEPFQDVAYQTHLGHILESLKKKNISKKFDDAAFDFIKFTMKRCFHVIKHTRTFCAICFPVVPSLSMVDVSKEDVHGEVETFCDFIGKNIQAKRLYIRCYGSPESEKISYHHCWKDLFNL